MIESHPISDRAAWLAMRRQDATASDIAAICGCSPFKTALRVWAEKTGAVPDDADSPIMRRGRHLEDGILNAVREEWPDKHIIKPGVYLRDPETRIGATPDAFVLDREHQRIGVVQCKLVARPIFEVEWAEGPPLQYQLQVLTELMLAEVQIGWLACYVIDAFRGDLRLFPIQRHPSAEFRILGAVAQFWSDVETGQPLKADYQRDGNLLALLRPPSEKVPPLDLSTDNYTQDLLAERERLMAECKERDDRLDEIRAELIEKLNGSTRATAPGWRIAYRMQTRKEHIVRESTFSVLDIRKVKQEAMA